MLPRNFSRVTLAGFFVVAGVGHFISPASYLAIMPPHIPWQPQVVAFSGAAEILGGLSLLWQPTRPWAGWGLIALLVAVFPANIQALVTGLSIGNRHVPDWLLCIRLPFQLVLISWVYHVRRDRSAPRH